MGFGPSTDSAAGAKTIWIDVWFRKGYNLPGGETGQPGDSTGGADRLTTLHTRPVGAAVPLWNDNFRPNGYDGVNYGQLGPINGCIMGRCRSPVARPSCGGAGGVLADKATTKAPTVTPVSVAEAAGWRSRDPSWVGPPAMRFITAAAAISNDSSDAAQLFYAPRNAGSHPNNLEVMAMNRPSRCQVRYPHQRRVLIPSNQKSSTIWPRCVQGGGGSRIVAPRAARLASIMMRNAAPHRPPLMLASVLRLISCVCRVQPPLYRDSQGGMYYYPIGFEFRAIVKSFQHGMKTPGKRSR